LPGLTFEVFPLLLFRDAASLSRTTPLRRSPTASPSSGNDFGRKALPVLNTMEQLTIQRIMEIISHHALNIVGTLNKEQLFDGMLVQRVRPWRRNGHGHTKRNTKWRKGNSFISVLTQFSLRTAVFTVLAGMPDNDDCAPTNWCQNNCEPKLLLEVTKNPASGVKVGV
jgi:hypothetical protein